MHNKNRSAILQSKFKLSNSLMITLVGMFLMSAAIVCDTDLLFAQHHGAPPPMATLGDRSISMDRSCYQTTENNCRPRCSARNSLD